MNRCPKTQQFHHPAGEFRCLKAEGHAGTHAYDAHKQAAAKPLVAAACKLCGEQPATLRVTVTDLAGTVLDTTEACRDCVAGGLDSAGLTLPRPS